MTDQPTYPYQDGDVTVLGPEIFASKGGAVISWRGENYIRQQDIPPRGDEMLVDALHELASGVRDLASAVRLENADQTRKAEREAADTVAAAALMVNLVRERAERAEAELRDRAHADSADAAAGSYAHRAEQAVELLRIAHETSNKSEAERARAVQRAEEAEAAIERVPADGPSRAEEKRACACPPSFMRQRNHHPQCPVAPAHNAGPSIAECRDADRRWPLEKHGE